MNSGLIAKRYADAFLDYVNAHDCADAVYGQVRTILSAMGKLPGFRTVVEDAHGMAFDARMRLVEASVAPDNLIQEIRDVFTLMHRNGRDEFFRLMLLDFLSLYREKKGIVMVQITTAQQQDELMSILSESMKQHGKTAVVHQKVDPSIVGGFIYESWGYRLDASVRRTLQELSVELKEVNRRLV